MAPRTPRPYIKPAQKLDLHVDDNSGPAAEQLLERVAQFLVSNGLQRKVVQHRRALDGAEAAKAEVEALPQPMEEDAPSASASPSHSTTDIACVGLRSVIKRLNKGEQRTGELAAVCLDSELVKSSAVAHIFALIALGSPEKCPFYILPKLSSTLSGALNLPKATAIGVGAKATELLADMAAHLQPVGLAQKKQPPTPVSTFSKPSLSVPKGKAAKGKKARKGKKGKVGKKKKRG